jgi:hypothetical protein
MHQLQFISLTFNDGTIAIMQFVLNPRLPDGAELPGYDPKTGTRVASDEAITHEIERSAFPDGKHVVKWRRIKPQDVPQDRSFRNAWRDSGQHIYHDMPSCREIHKQSIRARRAPLLQQLDVEYQRALEENNVGYRNQVIAKKRKLRDATDDSRIEAAVSPDELKLIDPLSN